MTTAKKANTATRVNKDKGSLLEEMKKKDTQERIQRLNEKIDKALAEEQFHIKVINKCDPDTLEVTPAIKLIDTKYANLQKPAK